eukprot:14923877-Alexandrium_andersonii.AAC.1
MGNVVYDRNLSPRKPANEDFWSPVAELSGIRVLEARAAAHRRSPSSLDLIQAYSQIVMSGDVK